jgi:hypothetical protein
VWPQQAFQSSSFGRQISRECGLTIPWQRRRPRQGRFSGTANLVGGRYAMIDVKTIAALF